MAKNKGIYRLFRTRQEFVQFKEEIRHFTRVFTMDFVTIALGRLGYGPKRLAQFEQTFSEVVTEYMDEYADDLKDDKDMIYSREKMEQELKQYTKDLYAPPEARYGC